MKYGHKPTIGKTMTSEKERNSTMQSILPRRKQILLQNITYILPGRLQPHVIVRHIIFLSFISITYCREPSTKDNYHPLILKDLTKLEK